MGKIQVGEDTGRKEARYWKRYRKERGSVLEKIQVGKRLSIREETDKKETW